NVPNAGSNSFPLNELDKSDYYWTVRAYNGNDTCDWAESFSFSTLYVGIDEISSISNLSIAPNPAVNSVNVEFTSTDNTPIVITIMDVLGKTVVSQNLGSVSGVYSKSFDISDLESGMYILEMKKGTATTSQKFLVK
ncbi:MAG: T9SS type A sorting domain-containing protein, partial [Bacteroidales bacterium]|nr:T9SS type A sorting domain-containing protein [Bacteroidales bacterium]